MISDLCCGPPCYMNYGYDLTGPLSKQGAEEFVSVLKQALTAYSERSNAPGLLGLETAWPVVAGCCC